MGRTADRVTSSDRERFRSDGVVPLPGILGSATLRQVEAAYAWSLAHPGPGASSLLPGTGARTHQDLANPAAFEPYDDLVRNPEIVDLVRGLFDKPEAWFMYEQVFLKEGAAANGRTPWHQDLPYLPVEGRDLVVLWINLDPVPAETSLEFVPHSHRGTVFDGSRFAPDDPTAPLYDDPAYPRLPDIEAERDAWSIVSWAVEPGDVIAFHPALLHGGGATLPGMRRRTLSLRFFGEDSRVAARPGSQRLLEAAARPGVHPLTAVRAQAAGSPFRHPDFPQVAGAPGT